MPYNEVELKAKVLNVPESVIGKYIVARLFDGNLWYFGTYETEKKAKDCCRQFENGIILERI